MKQGWKKVKLPEVIFFQEGPGLRKFQYTEEGIPFLNIRTLVNDRINKTLCGHIGEKEVDEKYQHFLLNEGDIICSTSGTIGKLAIVHKEDLPVMLNTSVIRFRELDPSVVLKKFIYYYLKSDLFLYQAKDAAKGQAQVNFGPSHLKKFDFVLPPLPEQQRIVAILDDAFAKIQKAKANSEQNLKNAKELFESYLQGVFEDKGDDWEEKTLGEVCKISSKLIDPKKSEYQNLIHIGAGNIETKKGTLIDLKTAKEENLISGKFLFDESMILYSKIRPYLMKVVNCEFQGLCSADIYPLVPIKEKMTKDFLYHLLLTKDFTDYAILGSQRAGMPKVNREHLFAYKFELPPIKEQKTIVQKLDGLSADTKKLEEVYKQKICDLEELKKSILHKAFSGEI